MAFWCISVDIFQPENLNTFEALKIDAQAEKRYGTARPGKIFTLCDCWISFSTPSDAYNILTSTKLLSLVVLPPFDHEIVVFLLIQIIVLPM